MSNLKKAREDKMIAPEKRQQFRQAKQAFGGHNELQSQVTAKEGVSSAGIEARRANPEDQSYMKVSSPEKHMARAREEHKRILDHIKSARPSLPKSEEKGVHSPDYSTTYIKDGKIEHGISSAGIKTREAANPLSYEEYSDSPKIAKEVHKRILSELKSMSKPNLPKSELEKAKIYDFKSGKMIADLGQPKYTTPPQGNLSLVPKDGQVPTQSPAPAAGQFQPLSNEFLNSSHALSNKELAHVDSHMDEVNQILDDAHASGADDVLEYHERYLTRLIDRLQRGIDNHPDNVKPRKKKTVKAELTKDQPAENVLRSRMGLPVNKSEELGKIDQGRIKQYMNESGINKPYTAGSGISSQGYTVRGGMRTISPEGNKGQEFRHENKAGPYDRDLAMDKAKQVLRAMKMSSKPNLPKSEEKGVHQRSIIPNRTTPKMESKSSSAMGDDVRSAQIARNSKALGNAKTSARATLKELKDMPKANLPKSEDLDKAKLSLVGDQGSKIGRTSSGKDIFSHGMISNYKDFSAQDHNEAARAHHQASSKSKDYNSKKRHFDKAKLHAAAAMSTQLKTKQSTPTKISRPSSTTPVRSQLHDPGLSGKVDYKSQVKKAVPGPRIVSEPFEQNRTIISEPYTISGPNIVQGNDEKYRKVKGNLLDKLKKLKRS